MAGEYLGDWNSSMGLSCQLMGVSFAGWMESGNQEPRDSLTECRRRIVGEL